MKPIDKLILLLKNIGLNRIDKHNDNHYTYVYNEPNKYNIFFTITIYFYEVPFYKIHTYYSNSYRTLYDENKNYFDTHEDINKCIKYIQERFKYILRKRKIATLLTK